MNLPFTRNYILHPVQTNLELCHQMHESGYSNDDINLVHHAYLFSINKVFNMYRGSGKPFINHLVGVAGYMVLEKQETSIIQAALMHALYQHRVLFGTDISIDEKRNLIRKQFGSRVDQLIWDYTQFELLTIDEINMNELQQDKEVLMLRIADEVEDLSNLGLLFHGKDGDNADVVGSALWRKNQKANQVDKLIAICEKLDLHNLKQALKYWSDITASSPWPFEVKTGFYSSVTIN